MAKIANVATTDTFGTWRGRFNVGVNRLNAFTIDESKLYANTLTANVRFVSTGSTRLGTTDSSRTIVNGLLSANGNLNVAGNTTISGILNVNGGINLGDATTDLLTITGRATVGTNFSVGGNTSTNKLVVTSSVTGSAANATFNKATITSAFTVSGNTVLGGAGKTQSATGVWNQTGNLIVSGNTTTGKATVTNLLTVSGNTVLGGAGKTANVTGWFGVTGRQSISTNLFVGGNTFVSGLVGVGTITPTSDAIAKFIHINDATSSGVVLQAARKFSVYSSASSSFVVRDETGAKARLTIDSNGLVTACNSLTVTNTLTSGNTTLNGTTTDNSNARNQTLTDGATINWDTSLGRVATVTIGDSRTIAAPTNLKVGTYLLNVIQGGTGSYSITWNSVFKWPGGVAPVLTTTVGARDLFTFYSDGTNLYGAFLPDVR